MALFYPRYYQVEAVEKTLECLWNEPGENPLIVMPTGSGKSPVISWISRACLMRYQDLRIVVATHVKELVGQNAETMRNLWHNAPYGIFAAGLNMRQSAMPISFVSIQSAVNCTALFGKVNILIIDEAHLIPPGETAMYRKFIDGLRKLNPKLVIIGLTATPFRTGSGMLTNSGIFTKIVFDYSGREKFVKLIEEGYLSNLISAQTDFQFDVSQVPKVADDFNKKALQAAVNKAALTEKALLETFQRAKGRKKILVFCAGIDHVNDTVDMLRHYGESAAGVHSKMTAATGTRDDNIAAFKTRGSNGIRWLVNDGVLTTGFDYNGIDCIVLLRPTSSVVLHVQILGRGTRPMYADGFDRETIIGRLAAIDASEKQNCLVLDFSGNTARLGPINDPKIPKQKGKGSGEVPIKICPVCRCYQHTAVRKCDGLLADGTVCGYDFPFETKLETAASTARMIAKDAMEMYWFKVDRVEYEKDQKPFQPARMLVHYCCGMRRFTEQVAIEHDRYPGKLARDWWRIRMPNGLPDGREFPEYTIEGLKLIDEIPVPTHVYVHVNTTYPRVTAVSWDGTTPEWKAATNG